MATDSVMPCAPLLALAEKWEAQAAEEVNGLPPALQEFSREALAAGLLEECARELRAAIRARDGGT